MEYRISRCLRDESQGRIVANNRQELLIVDMERFREKISWSDARGHEDLCAVDHSRRGHTRWPHYQED